MNRNLEEEKSKNKKRECHLALKGNWLACVPLHGLLLSLAECCSRCHHLSTENLMWELPTKKISKLTNSAVFRSSSPTPLEATHVYLVWLRQIQMWSVINEFFRQIRKLHLPVSSTVGDSQLKALPSWWGGNLTSMPSSSLSPSSTLSPTSSPPLPPQFHPLWSIEHQAGGFPMPCTATQPDSNKKIKINEKVWKN